MAQRPDRPDARAAWRYQLHGVRETGEELGRGSYAAVVAVDYKGIRCAAKKIYSILSQRGGDRYVTRFEEECRLLGALRHPHIVQFLGIYFDPATDLPVLVMEFLPTTLAQCIGRYGRLSTEICYAILRDVALGLRFLHEQRPRVVHRDLSANNVLLTGDMAAKISDLGVAKIIQINPAEMSHMTQTPGTQSYMAPETLRPNPRYDIEVDVFSFGVMLVHVLSGQWPMPTEATQVDHHNPARVIGLTEVERRAEYLNVISYDEEGHPLMPLIERCLSNSPNLRPNASELVDAMSDAATQQPLTFSNRVEMMHRINSIQREKETLQTRVLELERQMERTEVVQRELRERTQRQEMTLTVELEQLSLQVDNVEAEKTHIITTSTAREELHHTEMQAKDRQHQEELMEQQQHMEIKERQYQEDLAAKERQYQDDLAAKERQYQEDLAAKGRQYQEDLTAKELLYQEELERQTEQSEVVQREQIQLRERSQRRELTLTVELEQLRLQVDNVEAEKTHIITTSTAREELHHIEMQAKDRQNQEELMEQQQQMEFKERQYQEGLATKERQYQENLAVKELQHQEELERQTEQSEVVQREQIQLRERSQRRELTLTVELEQLRLQVDNVEAEKTHIITTSTAREELHHIEMQAKDRQNQEELMEQQQQMEFKERQYQEGLATKERQYQENLAVKELQYQEELERQTEQSEVVQRELVQLRERTQRREMALTVELEQLRLQVDNLEAEKTHIITTSTAREELHHTEMQAKDRQHQEDIAAKQRQYQEDLAANERQYQTELSEKQKQQEREFEKGLKRRDDQLQVKTTELSSQATLITQQRSTIDGFHSQLQKVRHHLMSGTQVSLIVVSNHVPYGEILRILLTSERLYAFCLSMIL